jgi:hypothetical protein
LRKKAITALIYSIVKFISVLEQQYSTPVVPSVPLLTAVAQFIQWPIQELKRTVCYSLNQTLSNADHSTPYRIKLRMRGAIPTHPLYVSIRWRDAKLPYLHSLLSDMLLPSWKKEIITFKPMPTSSLTIFKWKNVPLNPPSCWNYKLLLMDKRRRQVKRRYKVY